MVNSDRKVKIVLKKEIPINSATARLLLQHVPCLKVV